mmetsp:Transcript_13510/g.2128  ORF Transcript_13510/g.2128 Transcript_13510/m.2128 type:complete len:100 (-) Transcript_13510:2800-3099(-)
MKLVKCFDIKSGSEFVAFDRLIVVLDQMYKCRHVFDVDMMEEVEQFDTSIHSDSCIFGISGKIAVGMHNGTIRLTDMNKRDEVHYLEGHTAEVSCFAGY